MPDPEDMVDIDRLLNYSRLSRQPSTSLRITAFKLKLNRDAVQMVVRLFATS